MAVSFSRGESGSPAPLRARLGYLEPGIERPVSYATEPPPGVPWENAGYDHRDMAIADARSTLTSVDREGFQLFDAPTQVKDFLDDEAVRTTYYAEAVELALAATGAAWGHVFDHLLRRREAERGALNFGRRAADGRAAANGRVHNDYTETSGRRRLGLVLDDPELVAGVRRYAIVNIWRPLNGPVLDAPLALCDARTVTAGDVVESEVRYARRTGEIYLLTHSPLHRWAYFPAMQRHEALVFKQYDAQLGGVARFTPHAAFDDPTTPPDAPPRESIELRCLVVYD